MGVSSWPMESVLNVGGQCQNGVKLRDQPPGENWCRKRHHVLDVRRGKHVSPKTSGKMEALLAAVLLRTPTCRAGVIFAQNAGSQRKIFPVSVFPLLPFPDLKTRNLG